MTCGIGFSALQRAEIAEIPHVLRAAISGFCFSALQRAEIAEIGPAPRARNRH